MVKGVVNGVVTMSIGFDPVVCEIEIRDVLDGCVF